MRNSSLCQRGMYQYSRIVPVRVSPWILSGRRLLLRWDLFDWLNLLSNSIFFLSKLWIDVDECQANPCVNGTCVNLLGSYQCNCPAGYILVDSRICLGDYRSFQHVLLFIIYWFWIVRYRRVCNKQRRLWSDLQQHSRIVLLLVRSRLFLESRVLNWTLELAISTGQVESY